MGQLEVRVLFVRVIPYRLQAATTSPTAFVIRATRVLTALRAANAWQGASRRSMAHQPASCARLANTQTGLLEARVIFVRGIPSRLQAATTSPIASATRATQDRMEKSVWNASLAHTRRRRAMPPARLAHWANTRPRELQLMRAHASNVQSTRTHRRGRHHLRSACATPAIQARSPMPISATRAM